MRHYFKQLPMIFISMIYLNLQATKPEINCEIIPGVYVAAQAIWLDLSRMDKLFIRRDFLYLSPDSTFAIAENFNGRSGNRGYGNWKTSGDSLILDFNQSYGGQDFLYNLTSGTVHSYPNLKKCNNGFRIKNFKFYPQAYDSNMMPKSVNQMDSVFKITNGYFFMKEFPEDEF